MNIYSLGIFSVLKDVTVFPSFPFFTPLSARPYLPTGVKQNTFYLLTHTSQNQLLSFTLLNRWTSGKLQDCVLKQPRSIWLLHFASSSVETVTFEYKIKMGVYVWELILV